MQARTNQTQHEYELYNQMLKQYEKNYEKNYEKERKISSFTCEHVNIISERGTSICVDCGEEIQQKITHNKEWKAYSQYENKQGDVETDRALKKLEDRSIYKDVENLGFAENIVAKANIIYSEVTKGKIFRGKSRRAIVFACIFHAYKMYGKPQSHDRLMAVFSLDKKTGLRGLKHVNLYAPKGSKIRTTYITPVNLIEEIMDQFSVNAQQKREVIALYMKIKNRSSKLNRSRPQSIASGVVYYWICCTRKNISLREFTQKVSLSELTVNKIAKEIANVLETPEVL